MIGWLAGRAVGSALRSLPRAQQARAPQSDADGVTGIVIFMLLLPVMIAGVVAGYKGHASFGVTAAYILGFLGLLLVITVIRSVAGHVSGWSVLRDYAAPEVTGSPADGWRARAAQLREQQAAGGTAERERRVADLLSVTCTACTAQPGVPCAMGTGIPFAIVRKVPLALCHLVRMHDAVRYGTARKDDILAQFNNNVPEGVL